jgi:hypothetical protein
MGWSSGVRLLEAMVAIVADNVADDDDRRSIYQQLIEAFENVDGDDICELADEVEDSVFTETYHEMYPRDTYDEE